MLSARRTIRTSCSAPLAPREVAPDPAQPGAERRLVAQRGEPAERLQDRLLGRVGGAAGRAQERRPVALDERREGGAVAAAGGAHELGVGAGGHRLRVPRS